MHNYVFFIVLPQPTGVVEATKYVALVYYERKGTEDLVTFTAAKKLNALLQVI